MLALVEVRHFLCTKLISLSLNELLTVSAVVLCARSKTLPLADCLPRVALGARRAAKRSRSQKA